MLGLTLERRPLGPHEFVVAIERPAPLVPDRARYRQSARRNHGRSRSNTSVHVAILHGRGWCFASDTASSDRSVSARICPLRFGPANNCPSLGNRPLASIERYVQRS